MNYIIVFQERSLEVSRVAVESFATFKISNEVLSQLQETDIRNTKAILLVKNDNSSKEEKIFEYQMGESLRQSIDEIGEIMLLLSNLSNETPKRLVSRPDLFIPRLKNFLYIHRHDFQNKLKVCKGEI